MRRRLIPGEDIKRAMEKYEARSREVLAALSAASDASVKGDKLETRLRCKEAMAASRGMSTTLLGMCDD